jgi:glutamate/tyrosine decarboxylase-like PLP-dependent enzyme
MVIRHLEELPHRRTGEVASPARLEALLGPPPARGRPAMSVLRRLERDVLKYIISPHHPRFYGFIPSGACFPGMLGDFLASGFNIYSGSWLEASGPSQVELAVIDWFRRWLGMPATAGGSMVSGGSVANLTAIVVAREALLRRSDRRGRARTVLYASDQAHSSIERAARVLDLPGDRLRLLPTDDRYRLRVPELEACIRRDRRKGLRPLLVVANGGSTNTGSIDPLVELAKVCRRHEIWLHVDGAYGGFAVLTRRGRAALRGIGQADSVTLDPHKWLCAPYEAGCLMVRDRRLLRQAFDVRADYLQDMWIRKEDFNFSDYGIQLTRSSRALKIWLTLQIYGTRRIAATMDRALDLAARAARRLAASAAFEILATPCLGVICFRYVPEELRRPVRPSLRGRARRASRQSARSARPLVPRAAAEEERLRRVNEEIVRRVQEHRRSFLSSTVLRGRYCLRLCILNHRTLWGDILGTLGEIEAAAAEASVVR